ncbi:lytic transglycosylase domain-containing protein [Mucilaginibacter glaciei]|uniref:Transglycosylase SLT domain-containing protein n=1 Tax=Mucilaginibacter glaciei TaxID=2772109 RepID=A0A926NMN4_9SPHI|nr:lytic transglycosylase domain-containing protein [Mucilaginibacter glaciei]MBD1393981.1 transglycosylase SLT domain-containing protein [Mucilaginibacter glaciei]
MKRLFTFFICIALVQIVKANAATHFQSTKLLVATADTIELLPVAQVPVSIYKNVIYKRRLDSIQRDVALDYNEFVQGYIDNYLGRRDEMGRILGLSKYYFPIYEKALSDVGVPDEIKYLSIVESALNPNAVSRVGAAGPWQFMSETAKIYGLKMNDYVDERRDPVQASYAAAAYLKDAYQQFGDWLLAIASYNCGKSNVEKALELTGAHDYWSIRKYLPAETRGYVPAYIAVSYVMNYYKRHNLPTYASDIALRTDTVMVNKFVPLSKIAQVLGVTTKEIGVLNPAYRMMVVNGSDKAPRKLIIPLQTYKERTAALTQVLNNPDGPVPIVHTPPPVYMVAAQPKQVPGLAVGPGYVTATNPATPGAPRNLPSYHTTQKGDTFTSIAAQYGVNVDELMKLNVEFGGSKTVHLQPGLTVKVTKG